MCKCLSWQKKITLHSQQTLQKRLSLGMCQYSRCYPRTGQSITALIAWRKQEWRKEAADIPPSRVENDQCSTRQILALFRGQPCGGCWETGWSAYGPFRALRCHLELKLKLKILSQQTSRNASVSEFYTGTVNTVSQISCTADNA